MKQILDKGFQVEVLFDNLDELRKSYDIPQSQAGPEGLYHSYSELKVELLQLESAYPQIAKVYDIGNSWEKNQSIADRDILAIKISDNVELEEDEPEVLFTGAHHAREWISVEVPFNLAKYLVENYATDPIIQSYVDNVEIWIVPMVNPDGHQYSIDVDRWWRKNRRNNGGGSYGVDLNRNYGYMWGGSGSSPDPFSDIYRGTAPFSEPESQAIENLALTHDFSAMVTYHSYGQLILYPWGYTYNPPPDVQLLSSLSQDMANLIQSVHGNAYTPQQGSDLYITSGTTDDWFYGALGTIGFTIELRPIGFPFFELPESEIIPTWEENKPAALYLINWAMSPKPDIDANGSDGPVIIPSGDNLNVTLALDPGSYLGMNADWWIFIFYYDQGTGSVTPIVTTSFQSPLFNLPSTPILDTTSFPAGIFLFFFGVDMIPNGSFDRSQMYSDIVPVIIK